MTHAAFAFPISVIVVLTAVPARTVHAQHWQQFRGPQAGVAPADPRLPDTWTTTENVAWRIDIPGRSWSSPIVWGDHVFVVTAVNTKAPSQPLNPVVTYLARSLGGTMSGADISKPTDEHRWTLYDIDVQTGRIRWERQIQAALPQQPVHQKNSYASETPITDGERVYVYLGYAGLFAFDMNGAPVWSKPIDAPRMRTGWGTAASPVLHNGRIYIVNDNEERSFIAAFDARTALNCGAPLARTSARTGRRPSCGRTSSAPRSSRPAPGRCVRATRTATCCGARRHDVDSRRDTGRRPWVAIRELGYFPDNPRPTYAIRPGAKGDISLKAGETSNEFIAWSNATLASAYPSPLVLGDQYYTLMDRGFLTSNDPRTGKEVYGRQRIAVDSGTFTASPWAYNGKIFAISEDGDTYVMQAGSSFRLLAATPSKR
jgi:outer membrane protein assembly factor BamB